MIRGAVMLAFRFVFAGLLLPLAWKAITAGQWLAAVLVLVILLVCFSSAEDGEA